MTINAGFEKISKYVEDESIIIPHRKTAKSAGYDFYVAEDTVIPSWSSSIEADFANSLAGDLSKYYGSFEEFIQSLPYDLDTTKTLVKKYNKKITLVPTGVKAYMPDDYMLKLYVRSSLPLNHWLILGNGTGIIDADYYNNPDNEGHIMFQVYNFTDYSVMIDAGERIGQGVFLKYFMVDNDNASGKRNGGFGST